MKTEGFRSWFSIDGEIPKHNGPPFIDELLRSAAAALAQQAQPLTDDAIHEQIMRRYHGGDMHTEARAAAFTDGAKWARDRMAQQAQPYPCPRCHINAALDGIGYCADCTNQL
jgi:hypothetical protein